MNQNDIDEIDTLLADPSFDPIDFINQLLPDENSLQKLDTDISRLKKRAAGISNSIREAIRSYSVLGDKSEVILSQTQTSIVDLTKRIADIHDQATDTEKIVSQFCEDIKPLNNAKQNLQHSIAAINRLEMIPKSLKELHEYIQTGNYDECATHILALSSLLESFQKYSEMPQIKPLNGQYFDLKQELKVKINSQLEATVFRGSADQSNLALCKAIDAYQDDFRQTTIQQFCDRFLGPYDDAYRTCPLKDIKKRVHWFKQRVDFYNKQYTAGFPESWRMEYHLTVSFCEKTTVHLLDLLTTPPSVDEYLIAFEYIVKFEKKMARVFSTTQQQYIDKDAPLPEFDKTPEGIKEKYKYINDRDNHIPRTVLVPANEFIGMIGKAFAPHIDLYLQAERNKLDKIILTAGQNIQEELENDIHILNSSTKLIVAMKDAIEKCAGFNIPQALLDLFMLIKELLIKYSSTLTRVLPNKPKKDDQFKLICAISNTSAQLLSSISSLSEKVVSLVPDETKPAINVDDAGDSIGTELKKQLMYLSDCIIKECEPFLIQVGNNQWRGTDDADSDEDTGGSSSTKFGASLFNTFNIGTSQAIIPARFSNMKLPASLLQVLDDRFSLCDEWLSVDNFNRIRLTFIPKVVLIIHDALFKSKQASSQANATRILQSVKELKQVLMECTKADSKLAKKRVESEFAQIEAELTILCCPDVAMVGTYLAKAKTPSKDHFLSILKLRGIQDISKYSEEYDNLSITQIET